MTNFERLAKLEKNARQQAHDLRWQYMAETDTRRGTELLKKWTRSMEQAHEAMERLTQFTFGCTVAQLAGRTIVKQKQIEAKHNLTLNRFNYATA